MDKIVDIIAEILLVVPILGILASAFLWRIYISDTARPRSWVLLLFAGGSTIVSVSGLFITGVAVVRLTGRSIGEAGGLVLAIVLLILESLPLWYAYQVWKRRRGPNHEVDTSSEPD